MPWRFVAIHDRTALATVRTVRPQELRGLVQNLVARFEYGLWGWLADVDPRGSSRLCRRIDRRVTGERVRLRTTRWHAATSEWESRAVWTRPWRSGGQIA